MLNYLKNEPSQSLTKTENGANAYKTTKSSVLDFFAQGGALRNRNEDEIISLFTKSFSEDSLLAMKALFYMRDVLSGQGERNTFRVIAKYMADNHTEVMAKNLHLIPSLFGRWDDLYTFVGTRLEKQSLELMKEQFIKDIISDTPSLLGKWMASENASSYETKKLAKKTRQALGLTPKQYRKSLTSLRKKINIIESKMSAKQWSEIDYSKIPSGAGLKYRSAFYRNDLERYEDFLNRVTKGEVKVNTGTLYPYEIVRRVQESWDKEDQSLNVLWDNLPDYIGNNDENAIAVVDVSGSMSGLPMQVAISVGLYLAERNQGAFKNHFITFSSRPQLVQVQGSSLTEKVRNMENADWGMNTNIKATFDLILNTAKKNNLSQSELPSKIFIISDMEFDSCASNTSETLFETIRTEFRVAGYEMPNLVFWNVNARNTQFPMTMNDYGVQLVSGASPSIFTNLLKGNFMNAYDLMLDVLLAERYNVVQV